MRIAAVEGGGTTWVVCLSEGGSPDTIIERAEFPTSDPASTLAAVREWLRNHLPFSAVGIATFGPVDAKPKSPKFGYITSTPKPGWRDTDVVTMLGMKDEFSHIPYRFDTDVNAPALAEYQLRNISSITSSAYITVGTGVGVGLVINGKSVHGLLHPEAGHVQVRKKDSDTFAGTCPYHGCCIEGMCSTGALAARKGCAAADLPSLHDDDEVWDLCAYYLAQLCANLILIASPEHISIGGGVMNRACLYPKIRKQVLEILNEYIQSEMLSAEEIDTFIAPSCWGPQAGLVGSVYLGHLALMDQAIPVPPSPPKTADVSH